MFCDILICMIVLIWSVGGDCCFLPENQENGTKSCCINYYRDGDLCKDCPTGYYGYNCSKICETSFYGEGCRWKCDCPNCHHINGCMLSQNATDTTIYITSNDPENTKDVHMNINDTADYVPQNESDNTKIPRGSIDIEKKVIIIASVILIVLILLLLQNIYKKLHILSTRTGVLSTSDDVYETINPALCYHRFQARIDRMSLCCSSAPNNEHYV